MSDFDPYYKWLAIPPADQPPHHYRLLGLNLYEPDLDVISAAADRQMAHIRGYQSSAHGAASQRILNELAHARLVLLRPETKAAYDAELQRRLGNALPRAKPLKMATPFDDSAAHAPGMVVLPQPQASAQPQPLPRPANGLIRPQTLPAANKPPVRGEAHPQATTTSAAAPVASEATAPHERRRAKQRNSLVRSLVGVVLGGIAGTYIAGVILNFLGAPLPDGVRFLPGMGRKVEVAENETTNDPKNNTTANQRSGDPSRQPTVNQQPAVGTATNPWESAPFRPMILGPGVHSLSFVAEGGRHYLQVITSNNSSGNFARHPLGLVTRISGADVSTADNQVKLFAKPGGFATFVLPVRAAPDCVIEEGNLKLYVDLAEKEESSAYGFISREFNFSTWDKPTSTLAEFPLVESKSSSQIVPVGGQFSAKGKTEIFFILALNIGEDAIAGRTGLHLSQVRIPGNPTIGTITVRSRNAPPAPANIVVTQSQGTIGTAEKLLVVPNSNFGAAQYQKPAQLSSLVEQAKQQLTSSDPRESLTAASRAGSMDMTCALLLIGAQQAVQSGDVVLAATAFQRLNRAFGPNFLPEETKALDEIYNQESPGFQPASYAAWSIGLLERLNSSQRAEYNTLAQRAYAAAVESGDRDLIQRATLQVAGGSP